MTLPPVVSKSSAIIALDQIGQLQLLSGLFTELIIPPAVVREVAPILLPDWIVEQPLTQPVGPQVLRAGLGDGESEAIGLAVELRARWIILDDRAARRLAQGLGLPVIGTLGLLLAAKRRGLLTVIRPSVDALVSQGFHVAPELCARVLRDAGEGS
jgi:predicted nucleic acid-binding protein